MRRYAAKAAERGVSVRTIKRSVAALRKEREAALAGEVPARDAASGGLGRADPGPVKTSPAKGPGDLAAGVPVLAAARRPRRPPAASGSGRAPATTTARTAGTAPGRP
jgi:hypothetical protein